jgi:asparagine synthase (glutamine-hydrolysing)
MDDALVSVVYVPLSNKDNNFHCCESDGEKFWAVVDGSIYDPELRNITRSAKILVDSYLKHGTSALKSLDGNFSFVLYDGKERLIFSGRDKVGIKPLHYFRNREQIAFSSEIKGFIPLNWFKLRINVRNVQLFILYGRDSFHDVKPPGLWGTFFNGVFEIPSSHYVKLNLETRQRRLGAYWNPQMGTNLAYEEDPNILARMFLKLLRQSITQSLNDGEKIGVPLSGGIDSTFLAYLLEEEFTSRKKDIENLYTLSVVFPELKGKLPDESPWIKRFLRSSKIKNSMFITPSPDSFKTNYDKILWHYEQPLTDDSLFLLWEVARNAAIEGIKEFYTYVSPLTGGLTSAYLADLLLTRPFKGIKKWIEFKKTGRSNRRKIRTWFFMFLFGNRAHRLREIHGVSEGIRNHRDYWIEIMICGQWTNYFDRSAMAFGIELKEPFVSNSNFLEFAMNIPYDLRLTEGGNRFIHRKAMSLLKDFPKEIIWNPKKMAFSGTFKRWVYEDLFDFFLKTLSNAKYVNKMVNIPSMINKFRKKEFNPYWAWRIVNVELWCRVFFDKHSMRARALTR